MSQQNSMFYVALYEAAFGTATQSVYVSPEKWWIKRNWSQPAGWGCR